MGNNSEFIKCTGNCRVLRSRLESFVDPKDDTFLFCAAIRRCNFRKDENGVEYISLQELGQFLNGANLFGYFAPNLVYDFNMMYQSMSINGNDCVESKLDTGKPFCGHEILYRTKSFTKIFRSGVSFEGDFKETITTGPYREEHEFKSFVEAKSFFLPFMDLTEEPRMDFVKDRFNDISIVTTSNYLEQDVLGENDKHSKNAGSCKMYFIDEYSHYWFIEFLPNGEGMNVGTCSVKIDPIVRTFIKNICADAFCWSILPLTSWFDKEHELNWSMEKIQQMIMAGTFFKRD